MVLILIISEISFFVLRMIANFDIDFLAFSHFPISDHQNFTDNDELD